MMLQLSGELKKWWAGKDVFTEVQQLSGQVVRDKEGRQTKRVEIDGKVYYRKLHTGVGWWEILKNLLQGRLPIIGASNEWLAINRLHRLGVDTLTPVAYGSRGVNPATRLSFLMSEELTDTISLARFSESWPENPPPFALKKALIEKVAEITRTIHRDGINHRDLYICHFLLDVSRGEESLRPDNIRLFLVDLHRAQMRSQVPLRWLVKDLGSIDYSSLKIGLTSRDRLRFLRVYFQRPLREILASERSLLRRVEGRTAKLYQREVRKGLV